MVRRILWNAEKNLWLLRERGLTFEMAAEAIESGAVVDDMLHPNPQRAHQRLMVIRMQGELCAVPYVTDGETIFLKTMYINRDLKRTYGG